MNDTEINNAVDRHYLEVFGGFHPKPEHGLPKRIKTLLLLGPKEPGFWSHFSTQMEYCDGLPNPMDRWSTRVLTDLGKSLHATPYFPFGGPPFQPFIQWALATERAHISPVGLMVHDKAGLFISYRGALAFEHKIALAPSPHTPCETCDTRACTMACPVSALGATYDVNACKAELDREGNTCIIRGCRARRACPINKNYGRVDKQSAFHMEAFK